MTKADKLAELATHQGLSTEPFLLHFHSEATKQKTTQYFERTQQAGVRWFPSLVLQQDSEFEFIATGYRPLDALTAKIESRLAK